MLNPVPVLPLQASITDSINQTIADVIAFLPILIAALVAGSDEGRVMQLAAIGVKILIYYIVVTITLDTIGLDVTVLTNLFTTFVVAFFGALAIALAIGIGVAIGLGGQDYVAENIDSWVGGSKRMVSDEEGASGE